MTSPAAEGERRARELFGDARYEASRVNAPAGFRRDLLAVADQIVFGQIYSRPGMDLQLRSLCTISALTVLGHREQLKVHVAAALRIGVPADQIAEIAGVQPLGLQPLRRTIITFDAPAGSDLANLPFTKTIGDELMCGLAPRVPVEVA